MTTAVTIGCYRLTAFIELGILRWRRLIPDVPILLSDDRSPESPEIEALAEKYECDYHCPPSRRSHFSGDWNTICNSIQFAQEMNSDIAIKASQRVIPVLPALLDPMFKAFEDSKCQVVLPGQLNRNQIARPTNRFYTKFGVLSDLIGFRAAAVSADELLEFYKIRCREADARKVPVSHSFSETTLGTLLDQKFPGAGHKILGAWTNHVAGRPKLYLRKSQSSASDYQQVAMMEGLNVADFDLREWIQIEGKTGYRAKADVV